EPGRIWALRYPESNELWVLSPGEGGASRPGPEGDPVPAVVIASEPMDDQPGWRLLQPGELLVVDGLAETSLFPFGSLKRPLRRADLSLREAVSQSTALHTGPGTVVGYPEDDGYTDAAVVSPGATVTPMDSPGT